MTLERIATLVRRLPQLVLLGLLRVYQSTISPLTGPSCRYYPSCSQYAVVAVQRHGAVRGTWLALRRLGRCHPWTPGGVDDVPPAHEKTSARDHGHAERARSSAR
ncbi:membrane protein insertion efficiency factor YidD [Actinotalea sp.]|uniref:membrane protein insertion efficiency factor YidD n=1 Tax=Actinotalea sp. TaxID=1872145 RepID=UPI002BC9B201|nr:membrane protein insertion efficiency factor YidD [Actinotalea sp.]HQY33307.1 membrane protein insertion efficiency factor YidD [Actinotalea sp.]HRA50509.1 membrane protein insertion efficiency factor YidD [Actinotalea sp.]